MAEIPVAKLSGQALWDACPIVTITVYIVDMTTHFQVRPLKFIQLTDMKHGTCNSTLDIEKLTVYIEQLYLLGYDLITTASHFCHSATLYTFRRRVPAQ